MLHPLISSLFGRLVRSSLYVAQHLEACSVKSLCVSKVACETKIVSLKLAYLDRKQYA